MLEEHLESDSQVQYLNITQRIKGGNVPDLEDGLLAKRATLATLTRRNNDIYLSTGTAIGIAESRETTIGFSFAGTRFSAISLIRTD